MKKTIFTTLLLFHILSLKANNSCKSFNSEPKEKIFIHLNNNFFLTGEKLYYKAYCLLLNNKPSTISKIAYIELIDINNQRITKQKINLKEGIGYGDFFIDTNLKTSTYKFIAYTILSNNQNIFFEENIYIVNPFEDNLITEKDSIKTITNNLNKDNSSSISINKSTYTKREQVSLSLNKKLTNGTYSISVRQENEIDFSSENNTVNFSKLICNTNENHLLKTPEIRGNIISGKITSKQKGISISDIDLALSTVHKNPNTVTTTSNEKGEFFFILKDLNSSKIKLQILNQNRDNYNINISTKYSDLNKKLSNFTPFTLNENLSQQISNKALYLQIENAYSNVKKDSLLSNYTIPLFEHNKIHYNLDDYKRFKTVGEVIVEILDDVFFTKDQENYKVHVRSIDDKTKLSLPTLLFIDGYLVYNHNEFLNFNANRIKTISLLKKKYVYGSVISQGILFVETYKKDYKPNPQFNKEFIVLAPQPEKLYFKENYLSDKKERIPDYRTQLYWNPELKETDNNILFYTSDVPGNYIINIEGFTDEGKPVSLKGNFSVE